MEASLAPYSPPGDRLSTPHLAQPTTSYDVVVIGSGAAGSSVSLRLAQQGLSVLVVERGDFLKAQTRSLSEPIGRYLYDVVKDNTEALAFVGGQTKFYGAALYRLRRSDFEACHYDCGVSPAWPIGYDDLEPYYQEAEALYHVHGALEGDPSEPLHAAPFLYPPLPHHPIVSRVIERLRKSGTPVSALPRALDYGSGGPCVLCPTCDAYHCRIDAKMDAEIAALRPAIATGNVRLLTRTECVKVLTSPSGNRATGVVLATGGKTQTFSAGAVVVAAGIPASASLLRRSRTHRHPQGLGNAAGALGRYLSGHSVGLIFPLISWRNLPPMHTKTFAINGFHDGAPGWAGPLGVIQTMGQMPFWRHAREPVRSIARLVAHHSLCCFYATEALPSRESGLIFDGDEIVDKVQPTHNLAAFAKLRELAVGVFRRAGYPALAPRRSPYLWHDVGTACLGTDPECSVVDPDCQAHGIEGLYVVDQSVLPSPGTVNTALTIIALALRAGDHIAGSLPRMARQSEPRAVALAGGP